MPNSLILDRPIVKLKIAIYKIEVFEINYTYLNYLHSKNSTHNHITGSHDTHHWVINGIYRPVVGRHF